MTKRKNIFKPKEEKAAKASTKKAKKEKKSFSISPKTKRLVGLTLSLICIYLTISFISYLFTWKLDQDKVEGANFLEFVFTKQPFEISNWLGKLGAIISHRFIYNGFGIATFLLPFFLFVLSIKILTGIQLFSIKKTFKVSLAALVWGSIFFGFFFSSHLLYMGGNFGYQINDWLADSIGNVGTFFLLVFSFLALTGAMFQSFLSRAFAIAKSFLPNKETLAEAKPKEVVDKYKTIQESIDKNGKYYFGDWARARKEVGIK